MLNNDLINGVLETVGGLFVWNDVRRLLQDRAVKGVYWPARLFFASWGLWNLWYYPCLGQWWSFMGGVFLVSGSLVWSALACRFRKNI